MSKISPYRFKRFTRRQIEVQNRLFLKDPGLSFQMGEDVYDIHLEPEAVGCRLNVPLTAHVRVDERVGFQLCPEETLLAMMLEPITSLDELRVLPEQVRGVVLETAMEKILDRFDRLGGVRSTIERICPTSDGGPDRINIFFRLTRQKDGRCRRGWIRTNDAGLEWLAARLGRLADKGGRRLDHIPVKARIRIGGTRLSLAELNKLEPCDIILAEPDASAGIQQVLLYFGAGLELAGNLVEPDRVLFQDIITGSRETAKMAEKKEGAAQSGEMPVEQIPVKLVFEIGQAEVTMGQLRRLQPGFSFQLDEPLEMHKPVIIKANGVAVGRGEIVHIDERLGVRVLEFNAESRGGQ